MPPLDIKPVVEKTLLMPWANTREKLGFESDAVGLDSCALLWAAWWEQQSVV